jgi:DNA topoisomerase-1
MMKEAAAEDARVGSCTKCGNDLLVKSSPKTKGQFVGCSGWPECDVTYPLPQGNIVPVDEGCATCGTPQVTVIQFRSKPKTICLDPQCATNVEPELDLGKCPVCAREGRDGRIISHKNPKTLKRYARCTQYEICGVSYPLPQNGQLEATTDVCEPCEAPIVIVHTARGPWRVCVDPACPSKEAKNAARGSGKSKAGSSGRGSRKRTA